MTFSRDLISSHPESHNIMNLLYIFCWQWGNATLGIMTETHLVHWEVVVSWSCVVMEQLSKRL